MSKYPGSLYFEDWDNGAEPRDMLLFVLRLLVDLREGVFDDFVEERRSGITTTGMPPFLRTSRRDLLLDVVLPVVLDARLRCRLSGILEVL